MTPMSRLPEGHIHLGAQTKNMAVGQILQTGSETCGDALGYDENDRWPNERAWLNPRLRPYPSCSLANPANCWKKLSPNPPRGGLFHAQ